MVITKDSVTAKIFREILVASKTQKANTVSTFVDFFKGKGIVVNFGESLQYIFIKNKDVDKTCSVSGSFIISAICASLDNNDAEILFKENEVDINGIIFEASEISEDRFEADRNHIINPHIVFTKEQLLNIEKNFDITLGNYFISPTMTDVISFAVDEGNLYQFSSSASCWKITNVIADIDKVQLEQDYGHTTKIWTMPYKIFNFMKISDNAKVYFREEGIVAETNDFLLTFNCRDTKTTKFKNYLNYINSTSEDTSMKLSPLFVSKDFFDKIIDNSYETEEDMYVRICFKKGIGFDVMIETSKLSFEEKSITFTKEIELNASVVKYLLDNLSKDSIIIERKDGEIEFIDGNDHYFILNLNMD